VQSKNCKKSQLSKRKKQPTKQVKETIPQPTEKNNCISIYSQTKKHQWWTFTSAFGWKARHTL